MPKPMVGDNGSGHAMFTCQSKRWQNTFAGDEYAGLSETALYAIGGIIKHARALNAITNPSTNSYKRLVPHCMKRLLNWRIQRVTAQRQFVIPYVVSPKANVEARFQTQQPTLYLCFARIVDGARLISKQKSIQVEAADKKTYTTFHQKKKHWSQRWRGELGSCA